MNIIKEGMPNPFLLKIHLEFGKKNFHSCLPYSPVIKAWYSYHALIPLLDLFFFG